MRNNNKKFDPKECPQNLAFWLKFGNEIWDQRVTDTYSLPTEVRKKYGF